MENLLLFSILSSFSISLICGSLGCFVIWKKMAYFGDSLAHGALLGVALGILFSLNSNFSIISTALIFALLLIFLQTKNIVSIDSSLGILAHGSMALAIFLISFSKAPNFDLETILFGDITKITLNQIYLTYALSIAILITLYFSWEKLILITINQDLAKIKGINTVFYESILTLLIALSIAILIKIIGSLLITSLLIIPAATSKQISSSSIKMLIFSIIFAFLSSSLGIITSLNFQTPTGATIILFSIAFFVFFVSFRSILVMPKNPTI